jgi:hypothetical protein
VYRRNRWLANVHLKIVVSDACTETDNNSPLVIVWERKLLILLLQLQLQFMAITSPYVA